MALPGFGIVMELLPVFTRKPLFAYRVAAAGMIGVALLSFFVWQHHLFDSGINPDMRPLFMLTTELISIPTGFIYLVSLGTLWKAKIRPTVPMLFCLGMLFNFLIGGVTGVFLSDVPVDVTVHGSFFVLAHFHYTIMGGLIFAFFAGVYYWTPKLTGRMLDTRLGKIHFWMMFIFFNLTFFPLFIVGLLGQPRRVFEYASNLQVWNDFSSVSAFLLGASFLVFVANFVWTIIIDPRRAPDNPWDSLGLEWQTAEPGSLLQLREDPGGDERPLSLRRSRGRCRSPTSEPACRPPGVTRRRGRHRFERRPETTDRMSTEPADGESRGDRAVRRPAAARPHRDTGGDRVRAARRRGVAVDRQPADRRDSASSPSPRLRSRTSTYARATTPSCGGPERNGSRPGPVPRSSLITAASGVLAIFGRRRLQKGPEHRLAGRRLDRRCSAASSPSGSRSGSSRSCRSSLARAATPRASSAGRR